MKSNAETKKLRKQPKWKLAEERKELENEQKILRERHKRLTAAYEAQLETLEAAIEAKDDASVEIAKRNLTKIKTLREDVESAYNGNLDSIDKIAKVMKTDNDRSNGSIGAAVGVITGLGGLALGGLSLQKAYKSDVEGTLVKKKTLDVFKSLNPIRLFQKK